MRLKAFGLIALIAMTGFAFSQGSSADIQYKYFARISSLEGQGFIEKAGGEGIEDATVNMPLGEGDRIFTGENGRAELYVGYSTYIRMNRATKLDLIVLPYTEDKKIEIRLINGDIYINKLRKGLRAYIEVRDGEFLPIENGSYRISSNGEEIRFAVEDGYGELRIGGEDIDIGSAEMVVVSGNKIYGPERLKRFDDEFASWNEERNRNIERGYRYKKYLPPELTDYAWEFEDYGSWRYAPPYGWVWVPRRIYNDWMPYYYGYWEWVPGGWFWVGYEPWGWAVYHYGRWGWSPIFGWYWIPVPRWGYAWVEWTWFDDYIGWCPMDFYGRPIIIINNGLYNYYDYVPIHSSSWIFVRKSQFAARNIRRTALRKGQLRATGVSKVRVFSSQPKLRPVYAVQKTKMGYKKVVSGVSPATGFSKATAVRKDTYKSSSVWSTSKKEAIPKGAISKKTEVKKKTSAVKGFTSSSSSSSSKKKAKKKKGGGGYPSSSYKASSSYGISHSRDGARVRTYRESKRNSAKRDRNYYGSYRTYIRNYSGYYHGSEKDRSGYLRVKGKNNNNYYGYGNSHSKNYSRNYSGSYYGYNRSRSYVKHYPSSYSRSYEKKRSSGSIWSFIFGSSKPKSRSYSSSHSSYGRSYSGINHSYSSYRSSGWSHSSWGSSRSSGYSSSHSSSYSSARKRH